jgi:hypothetical protein
MAESATYSGAINRAKTARQHFDERLERLVEARLTWDSRWRDIARYILPQYDRFLRGDSQANKGDVSFSAILDGTATLALNTSAEGTTNGMTNPSRRWFLTRDGDPNIAARPDVETWQDEVTTLILEAMTRGNFYQAILKSDREYLGFGNSAMMGEDDDETILNWLNFAPGEYWLGVNKRLQVDTCYREFTYTAEQIVKKFGIKNVSETVRNCWENNGRQDRFTVVHAIEPVSADPMPGVDDQIDPAMRYRSVYFEKGSKTDHKYGRQEKLLAVSGYYEWPIPTQRMDVVSTDAYGYGLGHYALADIKELQEWTKYVARASEQEVDPPTMAPVSARQNGPFSTAPGARNWYNDAAGQAPTIGRLFESRFDTKSAMDRIAILQDRIQRTFYVDVFTLFSNMAASKSDLRALQVQEMRDEKLLRMGAVFQPKSVALDVIIDRYFGVMWRRGMLPEPPEDLKGRKMTVTYQSIIAQAQRAQEVANIERMYAFAGSISAAMGGAREPFHKLNVYESVDQYGDKVGVPPKIMRTNEEAQEIGAQEAAAMQAAQAAEVAESATASMKTLAETPTEGENFLNAISGAMQ